MSRETIYLTLFIQARGGLKRELTQHLRTRRVNRRPKGTRPPSGKGQIVDPVMISQRPAEVEDRAVPGHWEGDLVMGKRQTAIGTLVERWSRYVMLFPLPDGHSAEAVRVALAETVQQLPEHLWQSLTWDQGKEMVPNTPSSLSTPASRSTSVTPNHPGNAVLTKTPTDYYANTSPKAPTCPSSPKPTSTSPPTNSTEASTNPQLDDTIPETRRSVAMTP